MKYLHISDLLFPDQLHSWNIPLFHIIKTKLCSYRSFISPCSQESLPWKRSPRSKVALWPALRCQHEHPVSSLSSPSWCFCTASSPHRLAWCPNHSTSFLTLGSCFSLSHLSLRTFTRCLVPSYHSSSMDFCHPGPLSPLSPPPRCLWPWAMARTVSLPAAPGQSRAATWVSQFRPRLTIWSQKFQVKPLTKKADENAISHVVLLNIFLLCLTSLKIPALTCKMLKGLYFLSKILPGTKGTYCKVTKYKCTQKSWTHTHFCANVSWKVLCTSENVV